MVLICPFGARKTFLAVQAIAAVSGPTLIVTPSLSLVDQWINVLKEHLKGPSLAVYTGERKLIIFPQSPYSIIANPILFL